MSLSCGKFAHRQMTRQQRQAPMGGPRMPAYHQSLAVPGPSSQRLDVSRTLSTSVCAVGVRTGGEAASASARSPGRARTKEDLNDPAQIGASGKASMNVQVIPGLPSLTSYMTLPVEQYFVLDPQQIRHLGDNRFLLLVPRINILTIWLEPEVEIRVSTINTPGSPPQVVLQAENCRIRGSEPLENLRLDQRFCMRFTTVLTWTEPPAGSLTLDTPTSSTASGNSLDLPTAAPGSITGSAQLDVWCEVMQPFNFMPREVLQSSCNVVMKGLVNTLLPLFVRKLAADYEKWALEPEYRAARAQRSKPLAATVSNTAH